VKLRAVDADEHAIGLQLQAGDATVANQRGAVALGMTEQRKHVLVGVKYAGQGRVQRADTGQLGLEGRGLVTTQQ
jgi:hypothetical protein